MTQTPNDSELDRATDPEYAAVSSGAVVGLIIAILGVWPLLPVSKKWIEWPATLPDLVVTLAIFVAAPGLGLIVSCIAVRQIRRSHGVLIGRQLALAGGAVGAVLAFAWSGWLIYEWQENERVFKDLKATAYEVADELIAGRYEEVYDMIPEDFRERQAASPARFRAAMERLFRGGGKILGRRLSVLRIIPTEQGALVAPAEMRVEMENRILQIQVLLGQNAEKRWELIGVGGAPTFESMMKFGDRDEGPLSPPEPDTGKDDTDAPVPEPADATTP